MGYWSNFELLKIQNTTLHHIIRLCLFILLLVLLKNLDNFQILYFIFWYLSVRSKGSFEQKRRSWRRWKVQLKLVIFIRRAMRPLNTPKGVSSMMTVIVFCLLFTFVADTDISLNPSVFLLQTFSMSGERGSMRVSGCERGMVEPGVWTVAGCLCLLCLLAWAMPAERALHRTMSGSGSWEKFSLFTWSDCSSVLMLFDTVGSDVFTMLVRLDIFGFEVSTVLDIVLTGVFTVWAVSTDWSLKPTLQQPQCRIGFPHHRKSEVSRTHKC